MAAEDRFTFARRDVVLTFPGPLGPMEAHARATTWGAELLWGMLTAELRFLLEAGGCDRVTFQRAVLDAWQAATNGAAGSVWLSIRNDDDGLVLVTTGGYGGEPLAAVHLVRAAFFFEFQWRGLSGRFPLRAPLAGTTVDLWRLLPKEVQARLEGEGSTAEGINTQLTAQAREAIAAAGGGAVPSVHLPIGAKKRVVPASLKAWRERTAAEAGP
ncbi:hypothetical protein D3C72_809870 [compost metagenome]